MGKKKKNNNVGKYIAEKITHTYTHTKTEKFAGPAQRMRQWNAFLQALYTSMRLCGAVPPCSVHYEALRCCAAGEELVKQLAANKITTGLLRTARPRRVYELIFLAWIRAFSRARIILLVGYSPTLYNDDFVLLFRVRTQTQAHTHTCLQKKLNQLC